MKYVFAALVACLLAGSALVLFDTLGGTVSVPAQVSPAPESAVTADSAAMAPCPEPERNTAPRLRVSIECEGLRCRFDASATTDDRSVQAWRWDLREQGEASEPVVTHEFPADGSYQVGVGAIDACGLADYRTMTVVLVAGDSYSCVDCDASSASTSNFSRKNKRQGADAPEGLRRFSGGSTQPSPDADAPSEPEAAP